jgi:hypothetical protein
VALELALQWPWGVRDKQGKCRGIARSLPEVLPGKTAGQGSVVLAPESRSGTLTRKRSLVQVQYGPRSMTWPFLFLAVPGSALWPYNWPYSERYRMGEDMPWPQGCRVRAVIGTGGYKGSQCCVGG